jgi:ABC-type proline/glycine betaine transport system permease subunit
MVEFRANAWPSLDLIRGYLEVILPAAAPTIMTGMRISMGIAWLVIVAAEMLVETVLGNVVDEGTATAAGKDIDDGRTSTLATQVI